MSTQPGNSRNLIDCPKCKAQLGENNADFAESKSGYPYFDVSCKPCGHKWQAHHRDWYAVPGSRNPFVPAKIISDFWS